MDLFRRDTLSVSRDDGTGATARRNRRFGGRATGAWRCRRGVGTGTGDIGWTLAIAAAGIGLGTLFLRRMPVPRD